jgi:hypothetical protein
MSRTCLALGRAAPALSAALALLLSEGCGNNAPPAPRTYAVTGKLVAKDGQPLVKWHVEFLPVDEKGTRANGTTGEDGTFTLETIFGNNKVPGAVEGQYTVNLMSPMGADQSAQQIQITKPYTVKPEDSNNFTITVEKARR